MKALEKHRLAWPGKSDEWLFERLDNELKQKVEEIHRLVAENAVFSIASSTTTELSTTSSNVVDISGTPTISKQSVIQPLHTHSWSDRRHSIKEDNLKTLFNIVELELVAGSAGYNVLSKIKMIIDDITAD